MKSIPGFRVGRHISNAGDSIDFTAADVAAIATGYDPALHEAPLVVGHPKTDDPAYGWVKSVAFADGEIVAEPHQVDPEFDEMVAAGRFKKVSFSLYPKEHPANPTPGQYYLRHVGFLGARPPAIKGLRPIQYADDDAGTITIEFGEVNARDLAGMLRSLRDWILAQFGQDAADQALPGWEVNQATIDAAKPEDEPDSPVPGFSEEVDTVTEEELKAQRAEIEKQRQANAAKEAEFAEREAKIAEAEKTSARKSITEFAEAQVKAGKILPRDQAGLVEFMAGLDGAVEIEFAEGDKQVKKAAGDWFRGFIENLPPAVDYSERAGADEGEGAARAVASFRHEPGRNVDPAGAAKRQRALAYAEQHKVSFVEAVRAIEQED